MCSKNLYFGYLLMGEGSTRLSMTISRCFDSGNRQKKFDETEIMYGKLLFYTSLLSLMRKILFTLLEVAPGIIN